LQRELQTWLPPHDISSTVRERGVCGDAALNIEPLVGTSRKVLGSQRRFTSCSFIFMAVHQAYDVVEFGVIEQHRSADSFPGGAPGVEGLEQAKVQRDKIHGINTPPDGDVNTIYLLGRGR
jgi:hypothetical protein